MNSIISEGKTTNEAIEKGLKELNVSKDMVDVKILEEEKRSFYSILSPRVVKVELTIKENLPKKEEKIKEIKTEKKHNLDINEIEKAKEKINKFLEEFLNKNIQFNIEIKELDIYIDINGENVNSLIGYRGETINALQVLLTAIANRESSGKIRVFLDIAGYRNKRIKTLEELADKLSRTVIKTRKEVTLEPMTAYERKIIHTRLQNNDKVKTYSKGEEPYRKVVIALK